MPGCAAVLPGPDTLERVTATRPTPVPLGLVAQLSRFVAIGAFSALVDLSVYLSLFTFGMWVHGAKAIGFIVGTTTAYLLNRRFTFSSDGGTARFAGFLLLYGTTFAINVGMNGLMLTVLPELPLRMTVAFVIAQGTATVINFVMLRTVVFRR
ncbi:putative flippase GtrA [Pseudonocardia kunmingensis]|uniref:Putative flippase GtrA n=1 Tax=Pseudonocardia kunmingensis TaxID=630975 RepID=A0A543E3X6_9PSEU|nr:putative flippase GtrA [Pseudonocardia kunmingensis]